MRVILRTPAWFRDARSLPSLRRWAAVGLAVLVACSTLPRATLDPGAQDGERAWQTGDYRLALVNYDLFLSQSPLSPGAELARFRLGVCHLKLNQISDAQLAFTRYLNQHPAGQYSNEARAYLDIIARMRSAQAEAQAQANLKLGERAKVLAAQAEREPQNPAIVYELGETLWRMGRFNEAAQAYKKAVDLNPQYYQQGSVAGRLQILPDGRAVAKLPSVISGDHALDNPLKVRDQRAEFQLFQEDVLRVIRWYRVSGRVVNEGPKRLTGCRARVDVYDFSGTLVDTQEVSFGTLNPGESKPFVVNVTSPDYIYNISRFVVEPTYDGAP